MTTTTDLEPYAGGQLEEYRARVVMTAEEAKALDDQVRLCTKAVLREGTDFGVIPGTGDRKVLLKPGAEKLLQFFGFGFTCDRQEVERDDEGRKEGVTYRCTVTKRLGDGRIVPVTTCEGYAGYDEAKFYQPVTAAARHKAEARERGWAAKDRRPADPTKWQELAEYRAPWNTIIKMAQKRAIVGATIDATAAAGLFGQEEEDGPAAEDGGQTWFDAAMAEAASFTDPAEEGKLYVQAAHAARDGLCTPKQANHVQNRLRQRGGQLRKATPVDVEDLGRQAAAATPPLPGEEVITAPVSGGTSAVAGEAAHAAAAGPGAAEPGSDRHRKLVGAVQGHFKRLGFGDEDKADRLWAAGKLAGVAEIESLNDLDPDELAQVADLLSRCKDRKHLETVLAGAVATEAGTGA